MKVWSGLAVVALVACGDDAPRGIGQDTSQGEVVADTADAADSAAETGADATDDTAAPALPNACPDGTCASGVCRSGVCVTDPPAGAVSYLTDPTDNKATTTWPELGCVDRSQEPPAQTATATLYGAVSRFGKGRKTIGIQVDVFLAEGFDPSGCEAESSADAKKDCFRTYGTPVASALSVAATPASVPTECTRHEDCPLGYQCYDPSELGGACEEQFGLYEAAGVPLDTPLVIRAYATSNETQWHDTTVYNVVLHADRVVEGRIQYDAQMVSEGQWILTTNSVGLPAIAPEHGAVGGRVRDCATGERDAWPIADVRLGLAAPGSAIVYFNNLEDDTVPLIDRETTDILGRFAALDVPAGWNRIAGAARVDGQVVTIGSVPVYVAPNSLSIVSWPGTQPYWRQR
jgi:hypothetical protein